MTISDKLSLLRKELLGASIDAIIIPTADPHQSEYVADYWASRAWISGFTGSAGSVVISKEHAGLWTDSRYFIQAEKELGNTGFVLHKVYDHSSPNYYDWIINNMTENDTVCINGLMISKSAEKKLRNKLSSRGINLITHAKLIDKIWLDRPSKPKGEAFLHKLKYCGESLAGKWSNIKSHLSEHNADYQLVTVLDNICWFLNIRSSDVKHNASSISYLLIGKEDVILYIDKDKVQTLLTYFEDNSVHVKPYQSIYSDIAELTANKKVIVDPSSCNVELFDTIKAESVISKKSIIVDQKSIKNEVEIKHIKNVMIQDGVALAQTFHWLDKNIDSNEITEFDMVEKIASFRAQQENYFCESFGAIVGYKGNGAIVHYSPSSTESSIIKRDGILLCDSGGHYQNGTTDITRTFAFSEPTDEQKTAYTCVLMGHIDLDQAVFPEGTTGGQLDILARRHLWKNGLNYFHGTGHGVGFFSNVHEPPQGFATGAGPRSSTTLKANMLTSNEPGYYKEGEFGIRIENLFLTKKAQNPGFISFETVTLYPIDTSLIKMELLHREHVIWLNNYHEKVWNLLSPHLNDELKEWLQPQCAAI